MSVTKFVAAAFVAAILSACGSTPNTGTDADKSQLHSQTTATLDDFMKKDPSLKMLMDKANGYAVFPEIVTAAIGVGGAHGNGEVYQKGKLVGYADVSQANIGLQLGAQKFSELILFENEYSLNDFQHTTTEFDAKATAVAASSGAASTADYSHGVIVFTMVQGGLMAQAAVGGQKFRYVPAAR
jgi:lipid-binding SYLF domain-containing protein